jgi:hypothetical protein
MKPMQFEKWIFKVVEILHKETNKDETEIYCNLDLTYVKLSFLDNYTPKKYVEHLKNSF